MTGSRKQAFCRLYKIAQAQHGVFTAKQANAAGVARNLHTYHVKAGNWVREHYGIYRLVLIPRTEDANLKLWEIWSSNRAGWPQGVFSHQTALSLHGIQGLMPSNVHMTLPPSFRRSSPTPKPLRLHTAELAEIDISVRDGFRCTSPLRTILDLVLADTLPQYILRQALLEFLEQGSITRQDIARTQLPLRLLALFSKLQRSIRGK